MRSFNLFRLPCPRISNLRASAACLLVGVLLAGCASKPRAPAAPDKPASPTTASRPAAPEAAATPVLQRLADEAEALKPQAQSSLTRQFLDATRALPATGPRAAWVNEVSREYYSAAGRAALPAPAQQKLSDYQFDEFRYYYTKYGSPLAYLRALDFAAKYGFTDAHGKRILDFGYGSIGHLRLLASMGAHATGVDPDSYLEALYSSRDDQGSVPLAAGRGRAGSLTLVHGFWPKDARTAERVGQGYDLILSKNTLKRGYVKPEKKTDKRQQIDLGVSDDAFLKTVYDALNPGGKLVIYNLYPKPPEAKGAYNPQADARSPWPREQYEKAGLRVLAYDVEDHVAARAMGHALKWDMNDKGEVISDLSTNLFALVTVVEKPAR